MRSSLPRKKLAVTRRESREGGIVIAHQPAREGEMRVRRSANVFSVGYAAFRPFAGRRGLLGFASELSGSVASSGILNFTALASASNVR